MGSLLSRGEAIGAACGRIRQNATAYIPARLFHAGDQRPAGMGDDFDAPFGRPAFAPVRLECIERDTEAISRTTQNIASLPMTLG